jgi:hypothetical protein
MPDGVPMTMRQCTCGKTQPRHWQASCGNVAMTQSSPMSGSFAGRLERAGYVRGRIKFPGDGHVLAAVVASSVR